MDPLVYLSNFWRTREIRLINCEFNLILTQPEKSVLSNDAKATTFPITNTNFYVSVITLSTQDNTKLLQQLKSGFKRTINQNKYQPKVTTKTSNPYLDFLIEPIFEGVNRLFVLSFENKDNRTAHTKYYLPTAEIKYYVMTDRRNYFDQPVKNDLITYDNTRKNVVGQGDDYTIAYLFIS